MKDWKAECEKIKGQMLELARDRDYYRQIVERSRRDDEGMRNTFKDLLIKVLESR
jgi:hypothetical protein